MMIKHILLIVLTSALIGSCQQQDQTTADAEAETEAGAKSEEMTKTDKVMEKLVKMSLKADSIAITAENKAKNERVKELAGKMRMVHGEARGDLEASYPAYLQIPTELPSENQKASDDPEALESQEYDWEFVNTVIDEHEQILKDLKSIEEQAESEKIKEMADRMIPKMEKLLNEAKEIKAEIAEEKES